MAGRGVLTCRGRERSADLCVGGQTRTLVCLLKGVARAVLLSGTPSPTRPADVFVQVCAGVCVKGLLPVKVYVRAREVLSRTSPLPTHVNKYLDLKALTNYDSYRSICGEMQPKGRRPVCA